MAEFIAGGISPWARIESVKLFNNLQGFGYVIFAAELLFSVSTFYYIVNLLQKIKIAGFREFLKDFWNASDLFTVMMSIIALILYGTRSIVVRNVLKRISLTKGNDYIRLTNALLVNEYYNYVVALTVFTSTLKLIRYISFHKAFMQTAASLKLCFEGLGTFFTEFMIVFVAFTSFFYFSLVTDLEKFRDFIHSLEFTLAMSIGKFNFIELRNANQIAAWIFFVFSSKYHNRALESLTLQPFWG